MKYCALYALIFFLAGCRMQNEEIVKAKDFCVSHGMVPQLLFSGLDYTVRDVQCVMAQPKRGD